MEDELKRLEQKETWKRITALKYLHQILALDNKFFALSVEDQNTVVITNVFTDKQMKVNIAGDNIPAMVYDILRQGRSWLF